MTKRKRSLAELKAKVALGAISEELTTAELAKKDDLHPTLISGWKHTAIESMGAASPAAPQISEKGRREAACQERPARHRAGYFVGSLPSPFSALEQKAVKQDHPDLSLRRQCSLLSVRAPGFMTSPTAKAPRS